MKRTAAILTAVLLCLILSVSAFAENVYIVDDGEEEFVPDNQTTTTKPAEETTNPLSGFGNLFDRDAFDGYLDSVADKLGNGINSLLSGFENRFGEQNQNQNGNQNQNQNNSGLPSINMGQAGNNSTTSVQNAFKALETETAAQAEGQTTAAAAVPNTDLPSVLVVNNAEDKSNGISGSTLTLLVFIAAIVILVLVVAIALIVLTRRTEYNSSVMNKSTIASVPQPDTLSQFLDDDIDDDGNDYGNIAYWNDN